LGDSPAEKAFGARVEIKQPLDRGKPEQLEGLFRRT
jgi:hypothetical protein